MPRDNTDLLAIAARTPASGAPATPSEVFATEFESTLMLGTTVGDDIALRDAWQAELDRIEAATGQRFSNPMDERTGPGFAPVQRDEPLDISEALDLRSDTRRAALRDLEQRFEKLRADFPGVTFPTQESITRTVAAERETLRQERAAVAARTRGFAPGAAARSTRSGKRRFRKGSSSNVRRSRTWSRRSTRRSTGAARCGCTRTYRGPRRASSRISTGCSKASGSTCAT